MCPTVVDVTVQRRRALILTFDDGLVCEFPLADLRRACPCASCRGERDHGRSSWPADVSSLAVEDAELVGAWGISLRWNDGHDTGIYPWDSLREWYESDRPDPTSGDGEDR